MIPLIGAKSDFSPGESIVGVGTLVKQALANGYNAIAIADTMSVDCLPKLFSACKGKPIKPIIGCTFEVVDDINWRRSGKGEPKAKPNPFWRPKMYALNEHGVKEIMQLLTIALDPNHFYFKAQLSAGDLLSVYQNGNTILATGDAHSAFSHHSGGNVLDGFVGSHSGAGVVVELCPVDTVYYDRVNRDAIVYASRNGLDLVLTRPVYNCENEVSSRNTLGCILSREKVDSRWRSEPASDLIIKPIKQIIGDVSAMRSRLLAHYPKTTEVETLEVKKVFGNTQAFADRFDYIWDGWSISLPQISKDPFDDLVGLCKSGWKNRINKPTLGYQPSADVIPTYVARMKYELGVLKDMGFENYFLLVEKLVSWSKASNIMTGPGRGSVGGSLVAFLLGITDVDPIRFGLIFERFINPERLDLPDIDLDFMSTRRHEVVEWLTETFGAEYVAGISNYAMLQAASALRQVSAAHNLSVFDYSCSKQIPLGFTLEEAKTFTPDLETFANKHPKVWSESCSLQGVFRNYGKHAAGVIVSGVPISERAVVNVRNNPPTVNWDKRSVEDMGLVKLDVLGLSTLDLLSHAKAYIKEITGEDMDYTSLPLDDKLVMQAFGRAETKGVFQFEGGGVRHLLKQLAEGDELVFEDIVATTALFRPGPMEAGLMDDYVQIRQGAKFEEYLHESMRPALESTRSILIYQEQVMQLARDLAGFTMAQADVLRSAMGKKDPDKMAKERDRWVDGCLSTSGMDISLSGPLFDQIEKFAGYAFNKSHSVEYAVISYWAMYVKVHSPAAFYAAALTVLGEDKRAALVKDAREAGMIVMPPDINMSSDRFEVGEDGKTLYSPFQMLIGLSEKGAFAIMEAKKAIGGRFASKQEFIDTVNRRACNVRVQEKLDAIGAFAVIEGQVPPLDPSRLKDQKAMLPSLISDNVKADRVVRFDKDTQTILNQVRVDIADEAESAKDIIKHLYPDTEDGQKDAKDALDDFGWSMPYQGAKTQVVIILDSVGYRDINNGTMGSPDSAGPILEALKVNKISKESVYITSLVRCGKPKKAEITNALVSLYSPYLDAELAAMKPPVIVCLGGKSIRHISPEAKGGWQDLAGQSHYSAERDATIVWGMSPGMVFFEPSRQATLNAIFKTVREVL